MHVQYLTPDKLKGLTLLEMLLALGISAVIYLFSIQFYISVKTDKNFSTLIGSVDQLFIGLTSNYKAQCSTFTASATPMVVSLSSIANYLVNWNAFNPIVDSNGLGTSPPSYVLQYNFVSSASPILITVNACIVTTTGTQCVPSVLPSSPLSQSSTIASTQATPLITVEQVAVKIPSSASAAVYLQRLGATCLSTLQGSYVLPCAMTTPSTPPDYVVWDRLPSAAKANGNSPLWPSIPLVQQFNLQYTHDQMYELNSSYSTTQYYLCGG